MPHDPDWRDDPYDRHCPRCNAPIEIGDWYQGGHIVGTLLSCTQCSWEDEDD